MFFLHPRTTVVTVMSPWRLERFLELTMAIAIAWAALRDARSPAAVPVPAE